jgi:hypothetical protein
MEVQASRTGSNRLALRTGSVVATRAALSHLIVGRPAGPVAVLHAASALGRIAAMSKILDAAGYTRVMASWSAWIACVDVAATDTV